MVAEEHMWNIYYRLYIDKTALDILSAHAKKLVAASNTLQSWNESKYGSLFRFCDTGTFSKVVKIWNGYAATDREARNKFSAKLKMDIRFASAKRELIGLYTEYKMYTEDKKHGFIEANPMFGSNGTLHYSLDPLSGFHLAPASVPLAPTSLYKVATGTESTAKVVDTARLEFLTWCSAFKKCACNLTLRFFTGDALAFSQMLQHVRQSKSNTVAICYRRQGCSEPLLLDSEEYAIGGNGPLMFTVIDTSNLGDHLGALNVLVATSPLLENKTYATLFTEVLAREEYTHLEAVNSLICGDFASMALLLGLMPVEYYTKTTVTVTTTKTPGKAGSSDSFTQDRDRSLLRINWKRILQAPDSAAIVSLSFHPSELASLLFKIYLTLLPHETLASMRPNGSRSSKVPYYHRGSYIKLLQLVGSRVSDDWGSVVDLLLGLIEQDKTLITGINYIQELYLYLHLSGLHSVSTLQKSPGAFPILSSKWKHLPPVVCVTLKVPRSKLKIFTDPPPSHLGIHTFNASLLDSAGKWQNHYGVLQFSFGTVTPRGHRHDANFEIKIEQDEHGWQGNSPCLVSFLTPSWMFRLAHQPPLVSLCLQPSPKTAVQFSSTLGLQMTVYETALSDEANVFITTNWPNLGASSPATDFTHLLPFTPLDESKSASIRMLAQINHHAGSIEYLVGHADILSAAVRLALQDGGKVQVEQKTPFEVCINIDTEHRIYMSFPVPVASVGRKVRIARKSSYIEVIAPLLRPTDHASFPSFMHPTLLENGMPVLLNMPRADLDGLATVDLTNPNELDWIRTHVTSVWSQKEAALRLAKLIDKVSPVKDLRMDFKDSLFTMFMGFSGVPDYAQTTHNGRVFGLHNDKIGRISMVIMVSALRLDCANGTIILDAAALPLTGNIAPKVASWMQSLKNSDAPLIIKVEEEELKLWESLLPAYAERCRTWSHRASCEYKARKSIPVPTELGESPLCSCGLGMLPANFTCDFTKGGLPGWNNLAKYATRVAISPSFSVPMAEKQVGVGLSEPFDQPTSSTENSDLKMAKIQALIDMLGDIDLRTAFIAKAKLKGAKSGQSLSDNDAIQKGMREYMEISVDGCNRCGKEKQDSGKSLLNCAKCRKTKYCSAECQKTDWKEHKKSCGKN